MNSPHKDTKNKLQWNLLPYSSLEETMKAIQFGADRYQPNGWEQSENPIEFFDALVRHLVAWIELTKNGEKPLDTDSGLNHMAHIATNAFFLMYFDEIEGNGNTNEQIES